MITWVVCYLIEGSRWGFWWRAIKDDPEAAQSLGVEIFQSKMAAAAVSAFFTAVAGSFYAAYVSYIDPESVMSFRFSLLFALPAVLGGIGTLWGPALGALVLIPITEITRSYLGGSGSGIDLIIYGGLIMFVALAKPEGLISLLPAPAGGSHNECRGDPQRLRCDALVRRSCRQQERHHRGSARRRFWR